MWFENLDRGLGLCPCLDLVLLQDLGRVRSLGQELDQYRGQELHLYLGQG